MARGEGALGGGPPPLPTAATPGGRSARSVLVSCVGVGMKNLFKKVC